MTVVDRLCRGLLLTLLLTPPTTDTLTVRPASPTLTAPSLTWGQPGVAPLVSAGDLLRRRSHEPTRRRMRCGEHVEIISRAANGTSKTRWPAWVRALSASRIRTSRRDDPSAPGTALPGCMGGSPAARSRTRVIGAGSYRPCSGRNGAWRTLPALRVCAFADVEVGHRVANRGPEDRSEPCTAMASGALAGGSERTRPLRRSCEDTAGY